MGGNEERGMGIEMDGCDGRMYKQGDGNNLEEKSKQLIYLPPMKSRSTKTKLLPNLPPNLITKKNETKVSYFNA